MKKKKKKRMNTVWNWRQPYYVQAEEIVQMKKKTIVTTVF
jgi:hypothetical protein